jgi:hypothetical protein
VVELRGKYYLSKRLELNAFLPYVMNSARTNGATLNLAGVSDATVFAGYHLIRAIETAGVQSRLIVGGVAKLPTGNYQQRNAEGRRYPALTQPGSGTTDRCTLPLPTTPPAPAARWWPLVIALNRASI